MRGTCVARRLPRQKPQQTNVLPIPPPGRASPSAEIVGLAPYADEHGSYIFAGSRDGKVRVWQLNPAGDAICQYTLDESQPNQFWGGLSCISMFAHPVSNAACLFLGYDDGSIAVLGVPRFESYGWLLDAHAGPVTACMPLPADIPGGCFVSVGSDAQAIVWGPGVVA